MLLTTHYMAEADELCDRIAIIDHGKVLACDTPTNLKHLLQKQPTFDISAAGITDKTRCSVETAPGVVRVIATPDESGISHNAKIHPGR